MAERGVSEVIGFVLIFSLITVSISVVYVVGFSGLEDARDAEQLNNVERAFDVLNDNLDDIIRRDAPNRATEFRLYESDLSVGEPTRLTVTVTNVGSAPTYSINAYPLVYEAQGSPTTIQYVNGAVIRQDRNGALFLDTPSFVFRKDGTEKTAVLPLVNTRSKGGQAISGTGTVLIRATHILEEQLTARTEPSTASSDPDGDSNPEYDVGLRIQTSETLAPLWRDHLNDELETAYPSLSGPCSIPTPGVVECSFAVERLYVTATRIDVAIED